MDLRAIRATKVSKEGLAFPVFKDTKATLEPKGTKGIKEMLVRLDLKVIRVTKVTRAIKEI